MIITVIQDIILCKGAIDIHICNSYLESVHDIFVSVFQTGKLILKPRPST